MKDWDDENVAVIVFPPMRRNKGYYTIISTYDVMMRAVKPVTLNAGDERAKRTAITFWCVSDHACFERYCRDCIE
jgi:hypothetical protein